MAWEIEIVDELGFSRFLKKLEHYEKTCLYIGLYEILATKGLELSETDWLKSLGHGLYEFRLGPTTTRLNHHQPTSLSDLPHRKLLLLVFCMFTDEKVIIVLGAYNKGKDPSKRRQQREIELARKMMNL